MFQLLRLCQPWPLFQPHESETQITLTVLKVENRFLSRSLSWRPRSVSVKPSLPITVAQSLESRSSTTIWPLEYVPLRNHILDSLPLIWVLFLKHQCHSCIVDFYDLYRRQIWYRQTDWIVSASGSPRRHMMSKFSANTAFPTACEFLYALKPLGPWLSGFC